MDEVADGDGLEVDVGGLGAAVGVAAAAAATVV